MQRILKTLHLCGLLLLTSGLVLAWILPDTLGAAANAGSRVVLAQSAYNALLQLSLPGLLLMLATGVPMLLLNLNPNRSRWMGLKLALAGLVAGNFILFLAPTTRDLLIAVDRAAQGMAVHTPIDTLTTRNGWLALGGLGLVLAIVAISVIRPSLGRTAKPDN